MIAIDRDRVIKSLEYYITRAEFVGSDWIDCVYVQTLKDALILLKADTDDLIRQLVDQLEGR